MKNLPIGARLASAFLVMLALTAAVAASGYWGTGRIGDVTVTIVEGEGQMALLSLDAQTAVLGLRRFEKDYLLNIGNAAKEEEYERKWNGESRALAEALTKLSGLARDDTDKAALATARREMDAYSAGFAAVRTAIRDGRVQTPQDANGLMAAYKEPIRALEESLEGLAHHHLEEMQQQKGVVEGAVSSTNRTLAA
ncbi:MAG TPA: MCP four helix bundle domain-containing protein, partial [Anaeromyxobacteraceae bacterium]|nr:MCP four helix bundle domain-containing protein [Anaeromyxobacteraceae bacterium]